MTSLDKDFDTNDRTDQANQWEVFTDTQENVELFKQQVEFQANQDLIVDAVKNLDVQSPKMKAWTWLSPKEQKKRIEEYRGAWVDDKKKNFSLPENIVWGLFVVPPLGYPRKQLSKRETKQLADKVWISPPYGWYDWGPGDGYFRHTLGLTYSKFALDTKAFPLKWLYHDVSWKNFAAEYKNTSVSLEDHLLFSGYFYLHGKASVSHFSHGTKGEDVSWFDTDMFSVEWGLGVKTPSWIQSVAVWANANLGYGWTWTANNLSEDIKNKFPYMNIVVMAQAELLPNQAGIRVSYTRWMPLWTLEEDRWKNPLNGCPCDDEVQWSGFGATVYFMIESE